MVTGIQPRKQRSAHTTDVQQAGRTGGEAGDDAHLGLKSCRSRDSRAGREC